MLCTFGNEFQIQEYPQIRNSNPPVVTGICDSNKSRARYHRIFGFINSDINYSRKHRTKVYSNISSNIEHLKSLLSRKPSS